MDKLTSYNKDGDGANWQAQAVLDHLKNMATANKLLRGVRIARYDNGREQGYIFYLRKFFPCSRRRMQLNIAVYEHRNIDDICVVWSNVLTRSNPKNETIWAEMEDKWDVREWFNNGSTKKCADYVNKIFHDWKEFHDWKDNENIS